MGVIAHVSKEVAVDVQSFVPQVRTQVMRDALMRSVTVDGAGSAQGAHPELSPGDGAMRGDEEESSGGEGGREGERQPDTRRTYRGAGSDGVKRDGLREGSRSEAQRLKDWRRGKGGAREEGEDTE